LLNLVIEMAITTKIDKESNLRLHNVTGALTLNELMAKLEEVYSEPDFTPEMNVIWDLREADLALFTTADIRKVRNYVSKHWGTGKGNRAALVVLRDLDFGLSRMYEFFLESRTSSEVQVFRDYDKALEWITS
jgi:hypothetical protein